MKEEHYKEVIRLLHAEHKIERRKVFVGGLTIGILLGAIATYLIYGTWVVNNLI